MNTKIKNYVEVLFKDIPNTKKASELKEEILSTMNDHFEAHIAEGKSENQAYTETLADLGNIDDLLKDLEPEQELKTKIDLYRTKRAKNTAIAVMLYILSVVFVIGLAGFADITGIGNEDFLGLIGIICMFICIAVATGIIIFTHMNIPQDVQQYITQDQTHSTIKYHGNNKTLRLLAAFMKVYWVAILIIYLSISFSTGKWAWTWIIWIAASAIKEAIYVFFDTTDSEVNPFKE